MNAEKEGAPRDFPSGRRGRCFALPFPVLLMRFVVLALVAFLVLPVASAQRHRFAQQGDLALVIGVTGLEDLALRPYEGGIGFRYRAADQTVIGAAVALNLTESDREVRNESGETAQD